MSLRALTILAAAACAALLAAVLPARAQDAGPAIDSVDANTITIGDVVTITGHGFGAKKGKVVTSAGIVKAPAQDRWKVREWSDTRVVALFKKVHRELREGTRSLAVVPKGAEPVPYLGSLQVSGPIGGGVSPTTVAPRGEFSVFAKCLGSKKGKILVGDASSLLPGAGAKLPPGLTKAKVLVWDSFSVQAKLSKKLGPGLHDVVIVNSIATNVIEDALTVE